MKKIPLTQGKFAIVDDEDFEELNQHKWYVNQRRRNFYAIRFVRSERCKECEHRHKIGILMHTQIMNPSRGQVIDHINGNGLDNRRENLRACTQKENKRNRGINSNNSSGYKGVSFVKQRRKWSAQICVDNKIINLKQWDTPEQAARAYDRAARQYHGKFAYTNFESDDSV